MSVSVRKRNLIRRTGRSGYWFVGPFMVLFALTYAAPLVYAAVMSLFQTRLVGGTRFSGIDNYVRAFSDPLFWEGVGRMTAFLFVQVPIMLGIALFLALAIDSGRLGGSKTARLLAFLPYAVPGVVAALMWGYIYGKDFGPIAQIAQSFGLEPPGFLSQSGIFGSLVNIVSWEFIGYNMIIMYAALRAIPGEVFEAAAIDGAGQWRVAWSIKIPAIKAAIFITVIFSFIGTFQLFNEPNLLAKIAPTAVGSAYTPNLYAYNLAFINGDTNYAATVAFVLGIVMIAVSYAVQLSSRRKAER